MAKNQPDGSQVQLAWTEIKSLSNGLTRERVITLWKKDHPSDLCTDCKGTTKAPCQTCKATGRERGSAKDCAKCQGEQTVECKEPKCEQGKIPCPKPCVKPTDPGWYTKPDGKKWKRFRLEGQLREISEGHLGEIPQVSGTIPCPSCNKMMKVDCPKCHGTTRAPCDACTAAAKTNPCPDCQKGQVACKTCGGLGLKPEITGLPAATPDAPGVTPSPGADPPPAQ
jgi:hypothetical protein